MSSMPRSHSYGESQPVTSSDQPFAGPNSARVVAALRARFRAPEAAVTAELRGALSEYVKHLKDGGYSGDQIVLLLDRVMLDVGMDNGILSRGRLTSSITALFIEEFQRPDE